MGQQPYILWAFWSIALLILVFASLFAYLIRRNRKEPLMDYQDDPLDPKDVYSDIESQAEVVSAYYHFLKREKLPDALIYRLVESYAFQLAFAK